MTLRVTRSIIPNLFTLGNLFSGFLAIVHFAHGLDNSAAVYIGGMYVAAAAIFDMLDGIVARWIRAASELGVELDSLCDVVSFGIAPSVMLYVLCYRDHGPAGLLLAALPAMAGAYRLARFNVELTSLEDKLYFRGLPIPAAALTLVSYGVFCLLPGRVPSEWIEATTNFAVVVTAAAMVSRIRYDNIPRPTAKAIAKRPVFTIAFVGGIVIAIVSGGLLVFPLMITYILQGAVRHAVRLLRQRAQERLAFEDFED
jgi:CDP-diacylglycerol--serine O-phosphatidyltransferase